MTQLVASCDRRSKSHVVFDLFSPPKYQRDSFRCESTREETAEVVLAMKRKALTVVGGGDKRLLSDPGSDLLLIWREKEKEKVGR